MAKTSVVARQRKREALVIKYAQKREALKQAGDWDALQKLPRNSAPSRLRSRCSITGRGKGVYRKFGLGRNMFRQLALDGKIPGIKKSSW